MKHIKNWSRRVKSSRGVIDGGGRRLGEVRPSFSVETSYINPLFGTCENKKGKAKNFPSLYLARKENKKQNFVHNTFFFIFSSNLLFFHFLSISSNYTHDAAFLKYLFSMNIEEAKGRTHLLCLERNISTCGLF